MPVDMRIVNVKGDTDDDHAAQFAEALLNSLVQIATELVVLPEHHDLALRKKCMDVIGVDAPLGAKRRLPAHRPGKALGIAQLLGAGRDEELGNTPLVQEAPHREVSGRSVGAKHQEDVLPLHQAAGQIQCNGGIGIVVMGDEAHLAAVDAAALVDHLEICRSAFPIAANSDNGPV